MSEPNKNPYIIKRVKKIIHKGHGGSWKIAYADFVTAMMTFFLLMWLLSLLNKHQLQGISNYFKKPMNDVFTKQEITPMQKIVGHDPKPGSQLHPTLGQPVQPSPNSPFPGAAQNPSQYTNGMPQQAQADQKIENGKNDPATNKNGSNAANASTANTEAKNKLAQDIKNSPELTSLAQLKKQLESDLEKSGLSEYKNNLNFTITSDGLRIDLHDLDKKPMFTQGKLDFKKYAGKLLSWLGTELNKYPNRILIIGHTDSVQYRGSEYSNWELSTDRANTTRKLLEDNSMDKDKVIRVIGVSDTSPLDAKNTENSINRRIEIIVLTKEAAESISKN